jgi:ABC-type lipoprotein export system ATPase subunit
MTDLFKLKNVACQYATNDYPVLRIKELSIFEGEMVFIVGASGVGKSTALETLGLMNNTIKKSGDSSFVYRSENESVDLLNIWNLKERAVARFRRRNLSFIFQSTNLFNNLSAFQNVCVAQIVQGVPQEKAELNAKRLLKDMFDDKTALEIIQGKKVTELSGGQRQRLSFVRAIVTNYKVLFADEPTGNLDWLNAQRLIKVLAKHVRSNSRTAVIVTHDIELALNFADRIILINKESKKGKDKDHVYGKVDSTSVFLKENGNWENPTLGKKSSSQLTDYLKSKLN